MTETNRVCDRCGGVLAEGSTSVSIGPGPRHPSPFALTICPACADSLSRWLERRRGHHTHPESSHSERRGDPSSSRRHRAHPDRERRKRRRALMRGAFAFAAASLVAILMVVIYLTFSMVKGSIESHLPG